MTGSVFNSRGFTLIELVIVIIITGILATVAVRELSTSIETAKYEHTMNELNALAEAIVGNPQMYEQGGRISFGYVGDVGSLPPNLDALVTNPGGFATWDGPYVNVGITPDEFKRDGWDVAYIYIDTLIRSTGSGSNIDKLFAPSTSALLNNSIEGYVVDADDEMPGLIYRDSIVIRLTYPDGTGSTTTASVFPTSRGNFSFSGIPIGNHRLTVIYLPDSDTASYSVCVTPQSNVNIPVTFAADLW